MSGLRDGYVRCLLGAPSVTDTDRCVVCGRYANSAHPVIPLERGTVPRGLEDKVPRLMLCGSESDGCTAKAVGRMLHFHHTEARGWLFLETAGPMDSEFAVWRHNRDFKPIRRTR